MDKKKTLFLKSRDLIANWFKENRENHFFRQNRTPYRVWISEVVLQQTRISAASHKLERFLDRFPDLKSLASATESEVVQQFAGLGYYNRARQIHRAASILRHNEDFFWGDMEKLMTVPSIGAYTAAAISSICFGKKNPVIDGNIKRVLSRIFRIAGSPNQKDFEVTIKRLSDLFFEETNHAPDIINEGFMEFGQKICTPKKPLCDNCFLMKNCMAYAGNCVAQHPEVGKKNYREVEWFALIILYNNHVVLHPYKNFLFLNNHLGFPSFLRIKDQENLTSSVDWIGRFTDFNRLIFKKTLRHSITSNKIQIYSQVINLQKLEMLDSMELVPVSEVENRLVSSGFRKIWRSAF